MGIRRPADRLGPGAGGSGHGPPSPRGQPRPVAAGPTLHCGSVVKHSSLKDEDRWDYGSVVIDSSLQDENGRFIVLIMVH